MQDELQKQVTEINAQLREYRTGFKIIQWALGAFGAAFITAMFIAGRRAVDTDTQTRLDARDIEVLEKNMISVSQRIDRAIVDANARWERNTTSINQLKDDIRKHWNVETRSDRPNEF